MTDPAELRWHVACDGYTWRARSDDSLGREDVRYLEPAAGFPYEVRRYEPLEAEPALFRTLADLDPVNEETVVAFANEYGNLGMRKKSQWPEVGPDDRLAETLDVWRTTVAKLHLSLTVWDTYRDGYWNQPQKRAYADHQMADFIKNIFSAGGDREIAENLPPLPDRASLSLSQAALLSVRADINRNLIASGTTPFLTYQQDPGRLALRLVPRTLLGTLWLQFAQAVDEERDYRRCKVCGRWFAVTYDNEGRRKTRVFCSDACRSKAYRQRMTDARDLHAAGAVPENIAERLGVEVAVVRGWLERDAMKRSRET